MTRKIITVLFSLFVLVGCTAKSSDAETTEGIVIDEKQTNINFVKYQIDNGEGYLFSSEYRIINQSKEKTDPFYVNYVFDGPLLNDVLGMNEYSQYKLMGGEGIEIGPGESFQGGENIELLKDKVDPLDLQDIKNDNTVEIQIVHMDTEQVLYSKVIHNFSYIDTTAN